MGELGDQACGPGATVKTITQPRFFNLGQPEGYSPVPCPRCGGSGTVGGSKCPKCLGHGRIYVEDEKPTEAPEATKAPEKDLRAYLLTLA
jgi:DnaJ-class molecular chaperone